MEVTLFGVSQCSWSNW